MLTAAAPVTRHDRIVRTRVLTTTDGHACRFRIAEGGPNYECGHGRVVWGKQVQDAADRAGEPR